MIEAYSLDITVPANTAVPFNNVTVEKGCTARLTSPSTIALNKKGVYMVSCDATSETSATIQLYKDGVAQPQAQSIGGSPCFVTLVQVDHDNCECCCSSPTNIQVVNTGAAEATLSNVNICVTKVC